MNELTVLQQAAPEACKEGSLALAYLWLSLRALHFSV
jgi:hypothetical protein